MLIVLAHLFGCAGTAAFGREEHYESAWPVINYSSKFRLDVMVVDQRSYVLSGAKKPTFVGLMRAGFGNPFDITTATRQPLSTDIASAVVNGFGSAGTRADIFSSNVGVLKAADGASRLMVIRILEWKSDSYSSTNFDSDVSIDIYDDSGHVEAKSEFKVSRPVDSSIEAARQVLTSLLTAASIRDALVR